MLTRPIRRRSPTPSPRAPRRGANDNVPRRSGANDNFRPRNSAPRVPINPRRLARFGRIILRANPYINLLDNAINLYEIFMGSQPEGWSNLGSWQLVATCSTPDPTYNMGPGLIGRTSISMNSTLINAANRCTKLQAIIGDVGNPWASVEDWARTVSIGKTTTFGTSPRGQAQQTFSRPEQGSFDLPQYQPARPPAILPPVVPETWPSTADPALAPPFMGQPFSAPVPYHLNPIWRAPNRVVSNGTDNPPLGTVPNDWSVSIDVSRNPLPHSAPKTHELRPPRDNEKEGKVKASALAVYALKAVNHVTEGIDFVNALYDALPTEYRPKFKDTNYELLNVTPEKKAKAIFQNFDKINLAEALQNLISNEFEDRLIGEVGQWTGDISRDLGLNYGAGFNTLLRSASKHSYDAERATRQRLDGEN